jgi:cell division protein FtsB
VLVAVVTLVTLVILLVGVFPTQALLQQRRDRVAEATQLRLLTRRNDALDAETRKLQTDAEIERLAREQYNLVKPGEEAYAMLPTAPPVQAVTPQLRGGSAALKLTWWQRWYRAVRRAL